MPVIIEEPLGIDDGVSGVGGNGHELIEDNSSKEHSFDEDEEDITIDSPILKDRYGFFVTDRFHRFLEISEDLNNVISDFYEVLVTDFNGCMSSENVILENLINSVSVNELTSDDVKIYPNPSTGIVNIEFETLTEATLYDISGKLVMTITGLSETINIDQTGLYFLNYKNETKKIIIK